MKKRVFTTENAGNTEYFHREWIICLCVVSVISVHSAVKFLHALNTPSGGGRGTMTGEEIDSTQFFIVFQMPLLHFSGKAIGVVLVCAHVYRIN